MTSKILHVEKLRKFIQDEIIKRIVYFDSKLILFKSVIHTTDEIKNVELENHLKLLIFGTRNLIKCSFTCGRMKHI
jgi:hypothetical protein